MKSSTGVKGRSEQHQTRDLRSFSMSSVEAAASLRSGRLIIAISTRTDLHVTDAELLRVRHGKCKCEWAEGQSEEGVRLT